MNHAELLDGSALMNSLENELSESCMKLTGRQPADPLSEEEIFHTSSAVIVLDAEDAIVDFTPSFQSPSESVISPKEEDEEEEAHAPGELLGLSSKISHIQHSIDRLFQEIDRVNLLFYRVVWNNPIMKRESDPLLIMQKHILEQTKENLVYEIGELIKQKLKLESQEQKEALSPGQCTVTIKEVEAQYPLANQTTGKKVTYFLVEIEQKHLSSGWAVKRRYNDFLTLHRKLRDKFPIVDDFDFPGKSSALWAIVRNEVKGDRMKALELYLQVRLC